MSAAQENTVTDHNRVDIMRALFKAWWDATRPLEDGAFHIEIAWRAWQAAIASDPPAPAYTPQQMAANFRTGQNTDRMQQTERAGEVGDGLDVERLKKLISSIHSTVSLGHQSGPHAYAGEDFGRYLAEAAGACQQIMRALAALAARQPGPQEPVAWFTCTRNKLGRRISEDREDLVRRATEENADMDRRGVSECYRIEGPFPLYDAPPAQGIDLGQFRDRIKAAIDRIVNHQCLMRIPVDNTDPDIVLADILRLIDGQRDAAPGVGNG